MLQLIIPAYNEELDFLALSAPCEPTWPRDGRVPGPVEVIVVDNASIDGTARVALESHQRGAAGAGPALRVRGKGAAVRAGHARHRRRVVGFMDADGATYLEALDEAWRLLSVGARGGDRLARAAPDR